MNLKACCGLLTNKEDEDYDYDDIEQEPLPKPQMGLETRKKMGGSNVYANAGYSAKKAVARAESNTVSTERDTDRAVQKAAWEAGAASALSSTTQTAKQKQWPSPPGGGTGAAAGGRVRGTPLASRGGDSRARGGSGRGSPNDAIRPRPKGAVGGTGPATTGAKEGSFREHGGAGVGAGAGVGSSARAGTTAVASAASAAAAAAAVAETEKAEKAAASRARARARAKANAATAATGGAVTVTATTTTSTKTPSATSQAQAAQAAAAAAVASFDLAGFVGKLDGGLIVTKINRQGRAKVRTLFYDEQNKLLWWNEPGGRPHRSRSSSSLLSLRKEQPLPLTSLIKVKMASQLDEPFCFDGDVDKSFQLVFPARTVDLIAKDADEAILLARGFQELKASVAWV